MKIIPIVTHIGKYFFKKYTLNFLSVCKDILNCSVSFSLFINFISHNERYNIRHCFLNMHLFFIFIFFRISHRNIIISNVSFIIKRIFLVTFCMGLQLYISHEYISFFLFDAIKTSFINKH